MVNFHNNRPFTTGPKAEDEESTEKLGDIKPEHIANALLREAVQNARSSGNDIIRTLVHKVGLPMSLITTAKKTDFHTLEEWHRSLKQG